ncbi:hypothetical protein EDB89DRAFT_2134968 [Lactarius sanguifluus]|nr:hypothetical protein EDB89DRAFT_2134968 [Lactarius sanguifluus]
MLSGLRTRSQLFCPPAVHDECVIHSGREEREIPPCDSDIDLNEVAAGWSRVLLALGLYRPPEYSSGHRRAGYCTHIAPALNSINTQADHNFPASNSAEKKSYFDPPHRKKIRQWHRADALIACTASSFLPEARRLARCVVGALYRERRDGGAGGVTGAMAKAMLFCSCSTQLIDLVPLPGIPVTSTRPSLSPRGRTSASPLPPGVRAGPRSLYVDVKSSIINTFKCAKNGYYGDAHEEVYAMETQLGRTRELQHWLNRPKMAHPAARSQSPQHREERMRSRHGDATVAPEAVLIARVASGFCHHARRPIHWVTTLAASPSPNRRALPGWSRRAEGKRFDPVLRETRAWPKHFRNATPTPRNFRLTVETGSGWLNPVQVQYTLDVIWASLDHHQKHLLQLFSDRREGEERDSREIRQIYELLSNV